jgi:hypothetical protein
MNNTILIMCFLFTILCALSCSIDSENGIQKIHNKNKSKNISGTSWFSESLDTTGRFYSFDFDTNGTYNLTSEIPKKGVSVMEGNYKLIIDKLYLDDDTLSCSFLHLDTILLEGGQPNKYKLFRR